MRFNIGRAKDYALPLYGPDQDLAWTDVIVELDAAAEPRVRAFFTTVAEAASRTPPA